MSQRLTRASAISDPIPIVTTSVAKSVQTVERTVRSFVASDARTARTSEPVVGGFGGVGGLAGASGVIVVAIWLTLLGSARARRRGTRRSHR